MCLFSNILVVLHGRAFLVKNSHKIGCSVKGKQIALAIIGHCYSVMLSYSSHDSNMEKKYVFTREHNNCNKC